MTRTARLYAVLQDERRHRTSELVRRVGHNFAVAKHRLVHRHGVSVAKHRDRRTGEYEYWLSPE